MVESALGQSGSTVQGQHITMRLNQLPADSAGPSVPPRRSRQSRLQSGRETSCGWLHREVHRARHP